MEVRLINANDIVKVAERAYDAWNLAMATQDTNRGINKVFKMQELCKAVEAVAKDVPTINPEDLPIVQELREQLAKVTAERDAEIDKKTNEVNVWINCSERLPYKTGEAVLVIVSGKPHKNITLTSAIQIASFWGEEGWLVEEYPDWESPEVSHWMPLPELP